MKWEGERKRCMYDRDNRILCSIYLLTHLYTTMTNYSKGENERLSSLCVGAAWFISKRGRERYTHTHCQKPCGIWQLHERGNELASERTACHDAAADQKEKEVSLQNIQHTHALCFQAGELAVLRYCAKKELHGRGDPYFLRRCMKRGGRKERKKGRCLFV